MRLIPLLNNKHRTVTTTVTTAESKLVEKKLINGSVCLDRYDIYCFRIYSCSNYNRDAGNHKPNIFPGLCIFMNDLNDTNRT